MRTVLAEFLTKLDFELNLTWTSLSDHLSDNMSCCVINYMKDFCAHNFFTKNNISVQLAMQNSIARNEPSLIVEVPAHRPHLSHLSFYSGSTHLAIYGLSRS